MAWTDDFADAPSTEPGSNSPLGCRTKAGTGQSVSRPLAMVGGRLVLSGDREYWP